MKRIPSLKNNKVTGFTLIEVLVASVILFASIATVSMIYRGAFISSEKANNHMVISGVLPATLANMRADIREQGNSNKTQLSDSGNTWSVDYKWTAKLISHKSAPKRFDTSTGEFVTPKKKYKLWQVELVFEYKGLMKNYQLRELSWASD